MPTDPPTIETPVQVMFYDTDAGGVVHNLAYLRFIELARTQLAEKMGMGLHEMTQTQRYPVVVRIEVDYKRPAILGDHLVIRGRLDDVTPSRFWFTFEVVRPADGAVCVISRQTCALVQMPAGRPQRLPAEWVECFAKKKNGTNDC